MNNLIDRFGNLNIDDLIAEQPSFQKIMADGVVSSEERQAQAELVCGLLRNFEKTANSFQIEQLREILAELCVLVAINNQS